MNCNCPRMGRFVVRGASGSQVMPILGVSANEKARTCQIPLQTIRPPRDGKHRNKSERHTVTYRAFPIYATS